jgi:hypothetical protein
MVLTLQHRCIFRKLATAYKKIKVTSGIQLDLKTHHPVVCFELTSEGLITTSLERLAALRAMLSEPAENDS